MPCTFNGGCQRALVLGTSSRKAARNNFAAFGDKMTQGFIDGLPGRQGVETTNLQGAE